MGLEPLGIIADDEREVTLVALVALVALPAFKANEDDIVREDEIANEALIATEEEIANEELIATEADVAEPVKLPLIETSYPPFDVKAEYSWRISFGWIVFPVVMLELFKVAMIIYLD